MFITAEDFNVRPYKLPGLDTEPTKTEFESFVEDWEAENLRKIFGNSFYEKFVEGVAALPAEWDAEESYLAVDETLVVRGLSIYKAIADNTDSLPTPLNPNWELVTEKNRWLQIIKGDTYNHNASGPWKWPGLIVAEKYAIYSAWLKASVNDVSQIGPTVSGDVENSEVVSSAQAIATAHNRFARMIGGGYCNDYYNTLYGFLISTNSAGTFDDTFDETFDDFTMYLRHEFTWPGRLNQFNI
jgi:hypothetical protein